MIEVSKCRSVFSKLKDYCMHSGDHDFIEIIEWPNGEGYDIHINRKNVFKRFSLTHGEWRLLQVLMNWEGE